MAVQPGIVFGYGRESSLSQWALTFVSAPAVGEDAHIPFPLDQNLNLVYRGDVADLIATLAIAEDVCHQAYNMGSYNITVASLMELIERLFDRTVTTDLDAHPKTLVADVSHERAADEFGYELRPIEEVIQARAEAVLR